MTPRQSRLWNAFGCVVILTVLLGIGNAFAINPLPVGFVLVPLELYFAVVALIQMHLSGRDGG